MAGGSPLGYSSDYFFRMVVSWFGFVRPEYILYGILVGSFTASAFGVFLIAKRHLPTWQAFIFGLAAVVNPVIFYKYTAGHVDYLIAYAIFIYFVYYLLYRYKPSLRSALIVGLFMAFVGVQIQFFVIAGFFWLGYMLFNRKKWNLLYVAIVISIALAINMVWLSNFVFGGANVADISDTATKGSFSTLSSTQYLSIFNFTFSKATLISRFYGTVELVVYGVTLGLVVKMLADQKRRRVNDIFLLCFLLLMIFMATGLFQALNLGPLNTLYPMFREVGHFAPVIWLTAILLIARISVRGRTQHFGVLLLLVAIGISSYKFIVYPQAINFGDVRKQFQEFHDFDNMHHSDDYRSLSYPFFDQYQFTKFGEGGLGKSLPMRNTGHDSFTAFANGQFIKTGVKPQDFKKSVQYKLLSTLDVDVLQPYNIRYLYDFTDIYESNYEKYVSPATYDGDLSLIKNNESFFNDLLAHNPGKLRRVSPNILEVTNYTSRLGVSAKVYNTEASSDGSVNLPLLHYIAPNTPFIYTGAAKGTLPNTTPLANPYDLGSGGFNINAANGTLETSVSAKEKGAMLYINNRPTAVFYRSTLDQLTIYEKELSNLQINGKSFEGQSDEKIIATQILSPDSDYYISTNNIIIPVIRGSEEKIAAFTRNEQIDIYQTKSANLVTNGSFESGLWKDKVDDCNNFDKNGKINMLLDSQNYADGNQSLLLEAASHTACTSTRVNLEGGLTYLLSYDYQSPNANSANTYINFNDSNKQAIKQRNLITDNRWHTMARIFKAPDDSRYGQIFLHDAAVTKNKDATITRYDDVKLEVVNIVATVNTGGNTFGYTGQAIPDADDLELKLAVDGYGYENLIHNGSFESGLWQKEVTDCNNYDDKPSIAMSTNDKSAIDGKKSLQLSSKKHYACTYTLVSVKPNTNYQVTFQYRGENAQKAGYSVKFDDPQVTTKQVQVSANSGGWHKYSGVIHTPSDVTSLKFFLNAYERTDGKKNSVSYDDVRLIEFPAIDDKYYVVAQSSTELHAPKVASSKTVNETKRLMTVTNVKTPFFITLSENYHPGWLLQPVKGQNVQKTTAVATASAKNTTSHFEYNNYGNGWYIDPVAWCSRYPESCTKQKDGSYSIATVMVFSPQHWFAVSFFVSVLTVIGCCGYVLLKRDDAARTGKYAGRKRL